MLLVISGIILLILLALGAFFSAAETAMTALSIIDISALKEKSPLGYKIEHLLEKPEKLLSSLLIGNNIANISASAIVAYITQYYLGSIFIVISTFFLTILIIIFSEIIPKQIALAHKKSISLTLIRVILFFYILLSPLSVIILWFIRNIFPILNREKSNEDLEESLEHMINLAHKNNFITHYEKDFINNVLDLNDKTARQIMTHRKEIFSVDGKQRLIDIYPDMVEDPYSRVPVYNKSPEHIIGVLYLRDVQKFFIRYNTEILRADTPLAALCPQQDSREIKVQRLMKPASYLPDSVKVSDLFFHFKENDSNLVIVLDEYGGLSGIVSQEDVLEAVFGKLYDEDEEKEESDLIIEQDGLEFIFSGMLSIQEFEQYFDIEIEENTRTATMSGYICDTGGLIPEDGAEIEMPEGEYHVLKSDGKRIVTLRFRPKPIT